MDNLNLHKIKSLLIYIQYGMTIKLHLQIPTDIVIVIFRKM